MNRRDFIQKTTLAIAATTTTAPLIRANGDQSPTPIICGNGPRFEISLSQWSFHRAIFGDSRSDYGWFLKTLQSDPDRVLQGTMDPDSIVDKAAEFGVGYVDLVNLLFFGKVKNSFWLDGFKTRANSNEVGFVCLMCDECGNIGSSNQTDRKKSIDLHLPWMDAAARLGCTQLRVNAYGDGTYLAQLEQCAETLVTLADEAESRKLELIVENHGHPSSNAAWLAMLMQKCNHSNLGVFTDLDNFFMGGWHHQPQRRYDRVQGLEDLAPYTKGISAKSYDFDGNGNETRIDYQQAFDILLGAGFQGFASAEYEGEHLSEQDGTTRTIELLRQLQ